jgi:hypothetical protein
MRPRTAIAVVIACSLAALAPPAWAQKPKARAEAVAVAGLRPARRADFEGTLLQQLPQAQKLRALIEEVIVEVTGGPVIAHKGLRVIAGKAYMVEFMKCEGEVACVLRTFKVLRGTVRLLFVGDYALDKGEYNFRLRLLDLAEGRVLVEVTFSVAEKDVEDRALWREQLGVLFSTAGIAVETPSEATPPANEGEGGADQADPGETPAGEAAGEGKEGAEGAEGGADAAPSAGETDSDELTDADFGPQVTQIAVDTPEAVSDLGRLELSAVIAVMSRDFVFLTGPGNDSFRPDGFESDRTPVVGGSGKLFPFSRRKGRGLLARFGLWGGYARSNESASGGRLTRLEAGAAYRMMAGPSDTSPSFEFSAGFARHDYAIIDRSVSFPSVSYRGARMGIDTRLPLFTPKVALNGAARYIIANDAGAMSDRMNYGDSRVGGIEIAGSLELRPLGFGFVRLGIEYTRFSFDFEGTGDLSAPEPIGARDRFVLATFAAGLSL